MSATVLESPAAPALFAGDGHYEVVNGNRVKTPRMGGYETKIANELAYWLSTFFGRTKRLGSALVELLFRIDVTNNLQRRPDVAYVSYERWPEGKKPAPNDAWNVVPDLAVEVVSESNTANELTAKIQDYFRCGVRLVWVIYPASEQVYVYTSPTHVEILQRTDTLTGGDVIPGFELALGNLFASE